MHKLISQPEDRVSIMGLARGTGYAALNNTEKRQHNRNLDLVEDKY